MGAVFGRVQGRNAESTPVMLGSGYTVVRYPACVTANVRFNVSDNSSVDWARRKLQLYRCGANELGVRITSIVPIMYTALEGDEREVTMILPSQYTQIAMTPQPEDTEVRLIELPVRYAAVVPYKAEAGQDASSATALSAAGAIIAALRRDGLEPAIQPHRVCMYTAPCAIPSFRRGEVQVGVLVDARFDSGTVSLR